MVDQKQLVKERAERMKAVFEAAKKAAEEVKKAQEKQEAEKKE